MKETYTSAEARAALRVDAKTFLRWLEQADMQPQVSKADHRVKIFTQEQVQRLADEHERDLQASEHTLSMDERIAMLESRIAEIERIVHNKQPARPAPSPTSETPPPGKWMGEYIPIIDLIKQHNAPATSVMRHMRPYLKEGTWKTSDGRVVKYALDTEGQAEFMRRYGQ